MTNISQQNNGLSEEYLHQMMSIFRSYPHLTQVMLFGSRAKGVHKPMSDIDLALIFSDGAVDDTSHIQYQLEEETKIPYFFDVLNAGTITSDELKQHIRECGVVLYTRDDVRDSARKSRNIL